jgi:hypothetical protein
MPTTATDVLVVDELLTGWPGGGQASLILACDHKFRADILAA